MSHSPYRALCATLLFAAAGVAHAQFAWIGPDGTRQYSDRPPPPGTPASKIIKAPGRANPALAPAPAATAVLPALEAGAPADASPKGPPTLAQKEAAYRERMKASEEQDKKNREDAQRQRQQAERCAAARETQAQLSSGTRIARYGQDGEKRYMSDAERATRSAQVNQALQDCR